MAYGLVNNTTLINLGDAVRSKGMAAKTRIETVYVYGQLVNTPISPDENVDVIPEFPTFTTAITPAPAPAVKFVVRIRALKTHSSAGSYLGEVIVRENGNPVGSNYIYNTEWWKDWTISTTGVDNVEVVLSSTFAGELSCTIEVIAVDADGNYVEGGEIPYQVTVKNTLTPSEIVDAVNNATASPPPEAFDITGNCEYKFAYEGWIWFVELYGDKLTTHDITNIANMFRLTPLERIPFTINIKDCNEFDYAFYNPISLNECPKIRGTILWENDTAMNNMLVNCNKIRYFDDLFTPEMIESFSNIVITSSYTSPKTPKFEGCYSLRRVPAWLYSFKLNETSNYFPYNYIYDSLFVGCYSLDEAKNLPVWRTQVPQLNNMFARTFRNSSRIKSFTFETNADGSPIVTQWRSQTIDLTNYVGYVSSNSYITSHNSGITEANVVHNPETYAALKDTEDWFTPNSDFCRYNHDSAVETINSLPDTSAYLATAGGTNTIKFRGSAGSKTDGGAINTLTEEEIAVATAKGWTVSFA